MPYSLDNALHGRGGGGRGVDKRIQTSLVTVVAQNLHINNDPSCFIFILALIFLLRKETTTFLIVFVTYLSGDDGKPDFYSRKACNYLEVAVEVNSSHVIRITNYWPVKGVFEKGHAPNFDKMPLLSLFYCVT
jgi:hypothetical protein